VQVQNNKTSFAQMVNDFLLRSSEHELVMARECRVSLPTVRRWAEGLSAPHPLGRPAIAQFIEEHLRSCVCARYI
jgi:hypothetical protein